MRHIPWVSIYEAPNATYVVSSEYDNVREVFVYSWPGMGLLRKIPLGGVGAKGLMNVQGGTVRNGTLLLSTNQNVNPEGNDYYAFNLSGAGTNGTAPLLYAQNIVLSDGLAEMEGITIDSDQRLWTVTNYIQLLAPIYTLKDSNA